MLNFGESNVDNDNSMTSSIDWITEQFRANIVISGNFASFEEDYAFQCTVDIRSIRSMGEDA